MKHQIMTVMLDAFLIINALPVSFCKNASPNFFHGAFAPSFIWSRRPCSRLTKNRRLELSAQFVDVGAKGVEVQFARLVTACTQEAAV